jgi:hypothetical protein
MENSMREIKNELIDWIENTVDVEVLQKISNLKNQNDSSSLILNINSETLLKEDFDEQFAAGMSADELMENIAAHIESIASEESKTSVFDSSADSAV